MSLAEARIILRKVSACASSRRTYSWRPILVTPSTSSATSVPNSPLQHLAGGEGVLEHVVEQPDRDAGLVELEVGEQPGDVERMGQVRLARAADLVLVHLGREIVDRAQEDSGRWARPCGREAREDVVEADAPRGRLRGRDLASWRSGMRDYESRTLPAPERQRAAIVEVETALRPAASRTAAGRRPRRSGGSLGSIRELPPADAATGSSRPWRAVPCRRDRRAAPRGGRTGSRCRSTSRCRR